MPFDYYLALLQLHVAVVGVILAGIAALVQLLHGAKPRRDIRLLFGGMTLVLYGSLLVGILVLLALGSWVGAFRVQMGSHLGDRAVNFFSDELVGLGIILLMFSALAWFVELALRARMLLDTQLYLRTYVRRLPAAEVHKYLERLYAEEERDLDLDDVDPFQPIREYVKDNAFKYDDYGTTDGLRHFSNLCDKALESSRERSDQAEYVRLARYMSESCEEFFRIFMKTASEKRKLDTIDLLYVKGVTLLKGEHDVAHASLMPIIHGLEIIAKLSDDDGEVIACLERIGQLCDIFLDGHKEHAWDHIAGLFDEICLSVTRVTETYYLHKNNSLKTVPIVGYSTGENQTVTTALVDFFSGYRNLAERYTDATPLYYFDAIEGVIEVLFVRLRDIVDNGQQNIGFNMKYHELARDLYRIYYEFGQDAIQHKEPELLYLALGNLNKLMKPAKTFKLGDALKELCAMSVELTALAIDSLGDLPLKHEGRKLSEYTAEAVSTYVSLAQLTSAIKSLKEKDIKHTAEAQQFLKRLKPTA